MSCVNFINQAKTMANVNNKLGNQCKETNFKTYKKRKNEELSVWKN